MICTNLVCNRRWTQSGEWRVLVGGDYCCLTYIRSMYGDKQHTRGFHTKKHRQQMTSKRDAKGRWWSRVGGNVEDEEGGDLAEDG